MLKIRCYFCSETSLPLSFNEDPSLSLPERLRCRKCKFLNLREHLKPTDPYKRLRMRKKDRFINLNESILGPSFSIVKHLFLSIQITVIS